MREKNAELKKSTDDAVHQIMQAYQNLMSTVIRTYGEKLENGDYQLTLPVPTGGWLTAGKKAGEQYILVAKEIKDEN